MRALILLLLLSSFNINCQNLPSRDIMTSNGYILNTGINLVDSKNQIYLNDNWNNKLVVEFKDGKTIKFNKSNLNVTKGKFELKLENDELYLIETQSIKRITFNNSKFISKNGVFYESLINDRISFYKKYDLELQEGALDPISKQKITNDIYKIKENYLLINNQKLLPTKLKKKSFQKIIKENYFKKLKKFSKNNKLSFKKEKDVIKILTYYNSLLK